MVRLLLKFHRESKQDLGGGSKRIGKRAAILFLGLVVVLSIGIQGRAETAGSASMLSAAATTSQTAVLAAFLTNVGGGTDAETAISLSNILVTPPAISGVTDGDLNDTIGSITVYLYGNDGSYVRIRHRK